MRKLWGRANSINVMKVLWCLDELELEYEQIDAGMAFGIVETPEYLAKNPNGRIPTLEDDGSVLWESNVIVRYLAARYGAGSLWPEDPFARAIADQWMDWQQTTLHADLTYLFWGNIRRSPAYQDRERLARAKTNLDTLWGQVDAHLEKRDFIAGDALTMGDIPLGCAVWRWCNMGIDDRAVLPNVADWHERLQVRPGFRNHVAQPLS